MIGRLAAICAAAALLVGCTSSGDVADPDLEPDGDVIVAPASASGYTFTLLDSGEGELHEMVALVPVGRQARVTVSLSSLDETIDVSLDATVLQSGADGASQLIELVVVEVEAADAQTLDGLASIVGASSRVVRDRRLSVVEQDLEVPAGLAFRADTVVRQALRAPFALVGPLALEPVGAGASWMVESSDDEVAASTTVDVVASSADGFELRFEVPGGWVELSGQAGALLPVEQVITLDNATMTVTAGSLN